MELIHLRLHATDSARPSWVRHDIQTPPRHLRIRKKLLTCQIAKNCGVRVTGVRPLQHLTLFTMQRLPFEAHLAIASHPDLHDHDHDHNHQQHFNLQMVSDQFQPCQSSFCGAFRLNFKVALSNMTTFFHVS